MHPVLPYVLTSSDDMLIKLWDWDKGWACVQVFEGHSHYVMQVGGAKAGRIAQAVAAATGSCCSHRHTWLYSSSPIN